ncbi:MAG: hypothetical protein AAB091_06335 [Elusimicrobiota bacterium]
MPVDPGLSKILALIFKNAGSAPLKRELGHLAEAITELKRRRYSFQYSKLDENEESAHFDAAGREILVDTSLKAQMPEFQAAVLVHELQHAYDYFHNRPYALESEARAFKAECLYLASLDLKRVTAKIKDFYDYEWLDYLYAGRLAYLESREEFNGFVTNYFVKSRLGHRFEGLETTAKLLLDATSALEQKESRLCVLRQTHGPHQEEKLAILKAQSQTLQKLIRLLETEDRRNRSSHLPLTAP